MGNRIKDGLEFLQGENRLDKSAIKGLQEEFAKLREAMMGIASSRLGMRKVPIVRRVRLTNQVDGQTRTFNLGGRDITAVYGIWGSQFPFTGDDTDYTLSGIELTLGNEMPTPERGQTLFALVEALFYP